MSKDINRNIPPREGEPSGTKKKDRKKKTRKREEEDEHDDEKYGVGQVENGRKEKDVQEDEMPGFRSRVNGRGGETNDRRARKSKNKYTETGKQFDFSYFYKVT